ncbi:hypothetical protein GOODEAATRI_015695 [Goodea atripinnis]|uniref:Pyruvate dehydrogenase phosphatase regulatory subunit n=1 Tax=Goodea atripinnis TaxID=208336 RepID=A0ABV0N1R0_9TELE
MCSCVRSSRAMAPALLPRLLLPQVGFRLAGRGIWTSPLCLAVSGDSQLPPLPGQARVVICGGGIVGTSVAYHLAKLGWTDVVLLEQGRLREDGFFVSGTKSGSLHFIEAFGNKTQILERTAIQQVVVEKGHVIAVETDRGSVECEYFVNCAGQWAYELGQASEVKVSIPLHGCEHFYLLTKPLQEPLPPNTPGFEKNPKPIFTEGRNQLEIQNMQEDWDHFEPMLSALLRRMPNLESAEIHQLVNCPESFTPDMRCLMGETPGVSGYYVLAGMNSSGLAFAGGAGKYLAEWMTYGYPTANVWPLEIKRFGSLQSSRTFLRHRVMEVMQVKCCKEAVCVIDMSSFTKFELTSTGEQALEFLQYLCANDLDVPVGHIVHTGMLNERGGYENDCSVVRLSKNRFEPSKQ